MRLKERSKSMLSWKGKLQIVPCLDLGVWCVVVRLSIQGIPGVCPCDTKCALQHSWGDIAVPWLDVFWQFFFLTIINILFLDLVLFSASEFLFCSFHIFVYIFCGSSQKDPLSGTRVYRLHYTDPSLFQLHKCLDHIHPSRRWPVRIIEVGSGLLS